MVELGYARPTERAMLAASWLDDVAGAACLRRPEQDMVVRVFVRLQGAARDVMACVDHGQVSEGVGQSQ